MKFLILLRSINISGRNIVKMNKLKEELLNLKKYKSVETIIQSGNIIVDTIDSRIDTKQIESSISLVLEKSFSIEEAKMSIYDLDTFKEIISNCSVLYNGRDNVNQDTAFDKLVILFPCSNEYLEKDYEDKSKSQMNDSNYWVLHNNIVYFKGSVAGSSTYRNLDKKLKILKYTGRNYRTCQKCLSLLN